MDHEIIKSTSNKFAISIARFCNELPDTQVNRVYGNCLIRLASSVGAGCRTACKVKSTIDFHTKLNEAEEMIDHSIYYLELIQAVNDREYINTIESLIDSGYELMAILTNINSTVRRNNHKVLH